MNKLIKTAGISLAILSSSMMATAAQAAQKIGYVSFAEVVQSMPQSKAAGQKIESQVKSQKAQLDKLGKQIQTKIETLRRDAKLMDKAKLEKAQNEIAALDKSYKERAQQYQKQTAELRAKEQQKIGKMVQSAIQSVAASQGYDIIVDTQAVPYAKPQYDITDAVMKKVK